MPPRTEQGNANDYAAAWVADDPASSLRLALDALDGNSVRQAEPLLRWALGHLRETVVLRGHANWVTSASFNPDGQSVLTACLDHKVRVFAAADGKLLASIDIGAAPRFLSGSPRFNSDGTLLIVLGFDGLLRIGPWRGASELPVVPVSADVRVSRAALTPDNSTLITGHIDGSVRMSPFGTPGETVRLAGTPGSDPIACVAVSYDGRYAAAGTRTGDLRLWDLTRPGRTVVLPQQADWINTVEFSHDSRMLASASDDKTARLFSVPDGRLVADLRTPDRVNGATFSHNDKLLVTFGVDKKARVFDARTGDQRAVTQRVTDEVQSAAFSPDDNLLAMASVDGTAQICYTHNGSPLFKLTDHKGALFTVAFAPDGTTVVTASADQTARLWNVQKTGQVFWGDQAQVNTAVFGEEGRIVAAAREDGTARVFETATGSQIAVLAEHEGGVNSAAFNYDSTRLVTAGQDGTARVTAWQTPEPSVVLPHNLEVDAAVFTSDGNQVITSTRREAALWHWPTGERVMTFTSPPEERAANPFIAIIGVDISRDSSLVVTAHYDQKARLWDAATGAQLRSLPHAAIVYTAAFGDDSRTVITASGGDGHARLWDARTGELVRVLAGPSRQLRCAALSSDGLWAAAGDTVGRVTLWSVVNEQVAAVVQQHTDLIMSVVFSPDGAALLTASDDGVVKAVAIDSFLPLEELVPIARQRARLAAP